MARKPYTEEPEDNARWLVSYADFITLLFAFFVVMYASAPIEAKKLKLVSSSINEALGQPNKIQKIGTAAPATAPSNSPELLLLQSRERQRQLTVQHETSQMTAMADALTIKLASLVRRGQVRVSQNAHGITVEINSSILFAPADASLNVLSMMTIQSVAEVLKPYPNSIEVGGYTDDLAINTAKFPSNWELSAARASRVVRRLADFGISETRMRAIGYAANASATSNSTVEGRLRNRRVEIQILPN